MHIKNELNRMLIRIGLSRTDVQKKLDHLEKLTHKSKGFLNSLESSTSRFINFWKEAFENLNKLDENDKLYTEIITNAQTDLEYLEAETNKYEEIIINCENELDLVALTQIQNILVQVNYSLISYKNTFKTTESNELQESKKRKLETKSSPKSSYSLRNKTTSKHYELRNNLQNSKGISNIEVNSLSVTNENISQSKNTDFLEVLGMYSINYIKISNIDELIIDFDENLLKPIENYKPFEWPKTGFALKNEDDSLLLIIDYLSEYIDMEMYEIRNVSQLHSFKFSIALELCNYKGRPNAVVIPKRCEHLLLQMRVVFEFKTTESMKISSAQRKLELIGSSITSFHPVMVVQTDLKSFHLLVGHNKTIYDLHSQNAQKSIQYINYWLNVICCPSKEFIYDENKHFNLMPYLEMMFNCKNMHMLFMTAQKKFLNVNDYCYSEKTKNPTIISTQNEEKAKIISEIYRKKHERNKICGRSGQCHKIEIENQTFILKLHKITKESDPKILMEMKQEKAIYEFLSNKPEGNWPKLYYGGYLSDTGYYAICTNYIEGDCYNTKEIKSQSASKLTQLKKYCLKTIQALHDNQIAHLDVRAPNFIFKSDCAFIIDFGFSQVTSSKEHFNNDFCVLNGMFELEEEIREE